MKILYIAADGTPFETSSECTKYERTSNNQIKGEQEMKIKFIKKASWEYASTKLGSNKFKCSRCGQMVYVKPTIGHSEAHCEYKYCPNCCSEMK